MCLLFISAVVSEMYDIQEHTNINNYYYQKVIDNLIWKYFT